MLMKADRVPQRFWRLFCSGASADTARITSLLGALSFTGPRYPYPCMVMTSAAETPVTPADPPPEFASG